MKLKTARQSVRGAFTLMEMMIVVAIIMILISGGTMIFFKFQEDALETKAKSQIKVLETAALAYQTKFYSFPESLVVLTQPDPDGGRPYVDVDAIQTPWKGQFMYDPSGANNGTNKPDIWVDTPKGKRIGNWPGAG